MLNEINIDANINETDVMLNYNGQLKDVEKAVNSALLGLMVSGEANKQWFLENVLEALGCDLDEINVTLGGSNTHPAWSPGNLV